MPRRAATLELAVLGLLHDNPLHGYELRKQLTMVLGWGRVLSYGSLYPALKSMQRAGWIAEQPPLPQAPPAASRTGAVGRRQRIVYELTPGGDERFAALMAEAGPAAWEDDTFGVRFAFFGRTDREIRLRILEGRRARLEERLARVRQHFAAARDADTYATELARHGLESVEREVSWLSGLIAAERHDERPQGRRGQHQGPRHHRGLHGGPPPVDPPGRREPGEATAADPTTDRTTN